jgi:alpha-galactosidase
MRLEIPVDPARARVYEHGWQSWSPTTAYGLADRPFRPVNELRRVGNYRPDRTAPADAFWGEGVLAVDPGTGEGVHVVGTRSVTEVPSLRADVTGDRVVVTVADGADPAVLEHTVAPEGHDLESALARWADGFADDHRPTPLRPPPTAWCSWYHYFTEVTQRDVEENLAAITDLGLEVDVVQIDDGWEAEIGDWLALSDRFSSLEDIVGRIRAGGRRAGIWVAPFFLGGKSATLREHPDWAVAGAWPGDGWDQRLSALDTTHPGAEAYLREVFGGLAAAGIDYFKIDFLYAGAMPGPRHDPSVGPVEAYRHGLQVIREAIGPDAYLLGCGAPQLPSVGLVDAMRVGPDISHGYEPEDGDLSQPSQRAATQNSRWRAWMQGRFWVNDADCLVAGTHVERREEWATAVERYSGLRSSSDRLTALDEWGLATTRSLLERGLVAPFVP